MGHREVKGEQNRSSQDCGIWDAKTTGGQLAFKACSWGQRRIAVPPKEASPEVTSKCSSLKSSRPKGRILTDIHVSWRPHVDHTFVWSYHYTSLHSSQEVPPKCVVTHSFIHSAHSYWAQSICKAPMLQAWPTHDSLSQQPAHAQSPTQPREEHKLPKASTSDKKRPTQNRIRRQSWSLFMLGFW